MARLIDADELKKDITEHNRGAALAIDFLEQVDKQPAADAVEVVRCKDCVYGSQDPLIDIGINCGLMGISMLHDSFCSWSMKRDGGAE